MTGGRGIWFAMKQVSLSLSVLELRWVWVVSMRQSCPREAKYRYHSTPRINNNGQRTRPGGERNISLFLFFIFIIFIFFGRNERIKGSLNSALPWFCKRHLQVTSVGESPAAGNRAMLVKDASAYQRRPFPVCFSVSPGRGQGWDCLKAEACAKLFPNEALAFCWRTVAPSRCKWPPSAPPSIQKLCTRPGVPSSLARCPTSLHTHTQTYHSTHSAHATLAPFHFNSVIVSSSTVTFFPPFPLTAALQNSILFRLPTRHQHLSKSSLPASE